MTLPGAERATVDLAKLHDYCLNPLHPRGRHKARVFASALNLHQSDAEFLRTQLLEAAMNKDLIAGEVDEYGQRYLLDFECRKGSRRALVRSAWIVLNGKASRGLPLVMYYQVRCPIMTDLETLSIVALTEDLPAKGLLRGQVGTIVEQLAPDIYEVEFSDDAGKTYALLPVPSSLLMQLHHEPKHHAA